MAEAPAPGVQFPQPLVNPPAQGPQVPQVAQAAQVPQAAQVAQAAQVPQAVQVAQAAQVLPAAQGVPVPQAAQAAGQNAAQNVAAGGHNELEMYKEGWYVFNDLWNNGITEYVGKHPQTKRPETMHILIFEKCQARTTTSTSKDTTSLKQILTKALQMKQTNDTKQVKDNYVRILKSCSISVDLSISSKEMKEKILANEQIILSALSKKLMNMPTLTAKGKVRIQM
ncbi:hypothetical protein OS493_007022 [Desmophyllum pertusum]|uniref:Uncharacterized protein n=1 Tax=Desmophyllum pertusum TaxID=174260 RepID=A0A9W9ZFE5_9CNID|nr:hypothetical protein OS493_007022 [Desmophyllum pertusum]